MRVEVSCYQDMSAGECVQDAMSYVKSILKASFPSCLITSSGRSPHLRRQPMVGH
jgi:hypothetical protein